MWKPMSLLRAASALSRGSPCDAGLWFSRVLLHLGLSLSCGTQTNSWTACAVQDKFMDHLALVGNLAWHLPTPVVKNFASRNLVSIPYFIWNGTALSWVWDTVVWERTCSLNSGDMLVQEAVIFMQARREAYSEARPLVAVQMLVDCNSHLPLSLRVRNDGRCSPSTSGILFSLQYIGGNLCCCSHDCYNLSQVWLSGFEVNGESIFR